MAQVTSKKIPRAVELYMKELGKAAAGSLDKIYHDVLCGLSDDDRVQYLAGMRRKQIFTAINAMPSPPVRCLDIISDCPGCGAPTQVGTCRYCGRIMI